MVVCQLVGSITMGVPQGSIFRTLAVSIYVDDLHNVISSSDINMTLSFTSAIKNLSFLEKTLQADVNNVSTWLSVSKSLIRTRGLNLVITLNGGILKQVCSNKYLGVYLNQHLIWQAHVHYVFNRVIIKDISIWSHLGY